MVNQTNYRHWKLDVDQDNLLWITIDNADSSVNALSVPVFDELNTILGEIKSNPPRAVIFVSGKKNGFLAGADLKEFKHLSNESTAFKHIRHGQKILDQLEALSIPTIAVINGFALGGGLEFSLACRYRISDDNEKTRIGLPEVRYGIHPGWGGTVRLPRLIGPKAIELIMDATILTPQLAKQLGIVDAVVPIQDLKETARRFALETPPPYEPSAEAKASNEESARRQIGEQLRGELAKKVNKAHYPAPYSAIDQWVNAGVGASAMEKEAESVAKLFTSSTAQNLVHIFFSEERLKTFSKISKYRPQRIHVIGAGTMGGDIAAWCAFSGFEVTLQDQALDRITPALKRAQAFYQKKLKTPELVQATMNRLQPDLEGHGIKNADIIIEAIIENLEIKQALFRTIEPQMKPDAILATNTSGIPLEELQSVLNKPENLIGIHFFNPVAQMPLIEVVLSTTTSQAVKEKTLAFAGQLRKSPLPVKSGPGFLVNRLLTPYLLEGAMLLQEGFSPEQIDKAAVAFGMPMGPLTLMDIVSIDVCLFVAKNLAPHYHYPIAPCLEEMVQAKHFGVKTGKGFYPYQDGKRLPSGKSEKHPADNEEITDRLILILLNEGAACLQEKVVDDADLLDIGMILGTGFAPFRGGPMRYAKQRGIDNVISRLKELEKKHGQRFAPKSGWSHLK